MNHKIEIIGLGGGDLNQLPLGIYKKLIYTNDEVFVRTIDHPVIQTLMNEGVMFKAFDNIYKQESTFENVYDCIVEKLLNEAQNKNIIYAVPGHPMLAERTVQLLQMQEDISIEIVGGRSYLDDLFTSLKIDPIEGFQLIDANNFSRSEINYQNHIVFCQVYDKFIASEVKLTLLEDLPTDYPITIVNAVGSSDESIRTISIKDLDRDSKITNLTSVYVSPVPKNMLNHTFNRLREIVSTLRGPKGCEWDKSQTHETLREYAIEEVYELVDAIDSGNEEGIIEELGDVLLQVVLHSQIGEDQGYFSMDDVIEGITEKMIYRHPHVFGETTVHSIDDIHKNWDMLKLKEKGHVRKSILDGIPKNLPSLAKALKIQKKAAKVGFDWDDVKGIWLKLEEELEEVKEAINIKSWNEVENELGDVLFAVVNLARYYHVNPEVALNKVIGKFSSRFHYIEKKLAKEGKSFEQTTFIEMDKYWDEAKKRG